LLSYSRFAYRTAAILGRRAERAIFPSCSGWIGTVAHAYQDSGDLDRAAALLDAELERCRSLDLESTESHASLLASRARVSLSRRPGAEPPPLLDDSLPLRRRLIGVPEAPPLPRTPFLNGPEMGFPLPNRGTVYQALGDSPAAIRATEDALTVFSLFANRTS